MSKYSLTKWVGSKQLILNKLYHYFPQSFKTYLEPFVGSYSVVLNLPILERWSQGQIHTSQLPNMIVNDIDPDLSALGMEMSTNPEKLYKATRSFIQSESTFEEWKKSVTLTRFERAIRKLYIIHNSFNAMSGDMAHFGFLINSPRAVDNQVPALNTLKTVKEIARRLTRIQISNRNYTEFLKKFTAKAKDCFIYCDPPYFEQGKELYEYGCIDHGRLASTLIGLPKHIKWAVSYDDHEKIRQLYENFEIIEIPISYRFTQSQKRKQELLIMNYKPEIYKVTPISNFLR